VIDDADDAGAPTSKGLLGAMYRYRKLIGFSALLWFGALMAGGLFISQLDARLGLNLFGPNVWVAGEPAAIRVTLRALKFDRIETLQRAVAEWRDADGQRHGDPVPLIQRAGKLVQGHVTPPSAGQWTLHITAPTPAGPVEVSTPVTALSTAPAVALQGAPALGQPPYAPYGPVTLDVMPADQVIPGNLHSDLIVRATTLDGRPLRDTHVALTLREGKSGVPFPDAVQTDDNGLAELTILPRHPVIWPELRVPESYATRRMKHTGTQFALDVPQRIVKPGEQLAVRVRSLHSTAPVFIDVWHGDRWLTTTTTRLKDNEARLFVDLPRPSADPALLWVQVYRAAYNPSEARGGAYILVTKGEKDAALRWLASREVEHGIDMQYAGWASREGTASTRLTRHLLGRPARPPANPPLLADSSQSARQTVATMKGAWQSRFIYALVGSGLLLFIVLMWLVSTNYRDVQRRWIEAGGDADGAKGTRRHVLVEAAYIFIVLAIFLLGMIQLVTTIHW
jgi:hypothetical protein